MSTPTAPTTTRIQIVDGHTAGVGHAHAVGIDACLDLINSQEFTDGVPEEHLPTTDAAVAWFSARGLAHEDSMRQQVSRMGETAWLDRIHAVRAALREVWDAEVEQRFPGQDELDLVNATLREAPRIELIRSDTCCGVGHRHSGDDPTGEALARVIQPFVEAIAAGTTDRFRICANHGCRWVFEDTSRGGRRRWCDMTTCGNRAKVRRYRTRHSSDDDAVAGGTAARETAAG
jgi:predicted RNA-binding Zn ribbon-like protein